MNGNRWLSIALIVDLSKDRMVNLQAKRNPVAPEKEAALPRQCGEGVFSGLVPLKTFETRWQTK